MEVFTLVIITLVAALLFSAFKVLREYERGVVFMLGRFYKVKGPGLIIIIPIIQQMVRVDLRVLVLDIPSQDLITRDNVSVKVNAVLYFRVVDPRAVHHQRGKLHGSDRPAGSDHPAVGTRPA